MDSKVAKILDDLYVIDDDLRRYEDQLVVLVERLLQLRPDTKFDKNFAKKLRQELMQGKIKKTNFLPASGHRASFIKTFNLNNMFSIKNFSYVAAGAVAIILALVVWQNTDYRKDELALAPGDIIKLPSQAFGSLTSNENIASKPTSETAFINSDLGSVKTIDAGLPAVGMGGGGLAGQYIMPVPGMFNYNFKYVGENLNLTESNISVLHRVTSGQTARLLAEQIKGFNFNGIDLKNFVDLSVESITLYEDKDFGYMISFNVTDGSMSINQNWQKWPNIQDQCIGRDTSCYDGLQLKPSDVPADNVLISLADSFLQSKNISLHNYGEPQVERSWLTPETVYISDQISVIYPLLVAGKKVYEENGQISGLSVSVDIRNKKVAGVWSLTAQNYEESNYEAEQDFSRIIKFAEQGGRQQQVYYTQTGGNQTNEIELGTPELALVKIWQSSTAGRALSRELLVPAYVFPIVNRSADMPLWLKNVTVPLAKELLDEAEKNNNQGMRPLPMIEPFLEKPASSGDSSDSSAEICKDTCGNDVCEEAVCQGEYCPCAETPSSCPQDCK